ncbi:MAG TPA: hypothetical protein VFX48_03520 [Saprospiraceae bacterium]|nr:hypothetical protein [Saprospiraceae bacterium]
MNRIMHSILEAIKTFAAMRWRILCGCPLCCFIVLAGPLEVKAQVDSGFVCVLEQVRYQRAKGPVVYIDEAHHNYHTASGRFRPFAEVWRANGFKVRSSPQTFTKGFLDSVKILVIANALHVSNVSQWELPIPSAFSTAELEAVHEWVRNGGRLFLIADHMPFGGAVIELAARFKVDWFNCFAMDSRHRNVEVFSRANGSLIEGPANDNLVGNIQQVVTFTGSAFTLPDGRTPVIHLEGYRLLFPRAAWVFDEDMKHEEATRKHGQLAYMRYGKGKLVLSGEAAMWTSQLAGRQYIGLRHPDARDHIRLLTNVMAWLDEE